MSYRRNRATRVTTIGDKIVIETDTRRANAILQVLAGGSLQEVAEQFGVTRERIRQYLNDAGLTAHSRIRLRPTSATVQRRWEGMTKEEQRANWARQRRETRKRNAARAVVYLRDYYDRNGIVPTMQQLCEALLGRPVPRNQAAPRLAALFGSNPSPQGRREVRRIHAVYHMAGLEPRGRGTGTPTELGRRARAKSLAAWRREHPQEFRAHMKRLHRLNRERQRRHRRKS